jgi:hypothetical protein
MSTPATSQQIKAQCPGASADFILREITSGASIEHARNAWIKIQQDRLDRLQAERDDIPEPSEAPGKKKKKKKGTQVPDQLDDDDSDMEEGEEDDDEEEDGDTCLPVQEYGRLIRQRMSQTGCSRIEAVTAVSKANPRLHRAYLRATNHKKARDLIDERFEKRRVRRRG